MSGPVGTWSDDHLWTECQREGGPAARELVRRHRIALSRAYVLRRALEWVLPFLRDAHADSCPVTSNPECGTCRCGFDEAQAVRTVVSDAR